MSTKKLQILGSFGNKIYAQNEEPVDAAEGSLWVDLDEGEASSGGGAVSNITVDSALNSTSENPVQNKVVNAAINKLNNLVGNMKVSDQINAAIDKIPAAPVTSVNGMTGDVVIEAGGGTSVQPDWNQNDPDAPDYVKNRTHYTIAEGFEITWDGDTSNTDTFVMMSIEGMELPLYHISDETPSNEGLEHCTLKSSMANQNGEVISTNTLPVGEMWESFVQGGFITEKFAYMQYVAVVREENTVINGVTFPKVGTYFLYMDMGEQGIGYMVELSRPSNVVKLDEVYLPDSIVGHHGNGTGAEVFNDYVYNTASGMYSHAEGYNNSARNYAHAEGYRTLASGDASHTEGRDTYASGNYAHTEGFGTQAYGEASHAEGGSNAGGFLVTAIGDYSHAEGRITTAFGKSSHSGGAETLAFGESSNATGYCTTAYGAYSRAENKNTFAYGPNSHAEGSGVFVNMRLFNVEAGVTSHSYIDSWILSYSGGNRNSTLEECVGGYAIPEMSILSKIGKDKYKDLILKIVSVDTVNKIITFDKPFSPEQAEDVDIALNLYGSGAYGVSSHVEGSNTIAVGRDQHVQGKYNIADTENRYAHIVGNGDTVYDSSNYVYHTNRSNAHTVDWDGNAWFAGDVYVGGTSQDDGERLARLSDISDTISSVSDLEEITGKTVYVKWNVNGEYEFAPDPAGDALVKLSDEVPSMDSIVGATFAATIAQNGETKTETKLVTSDVVVETDYGYILGYAESGGLYFITAESAVIAEATLTKGVWCQNLAKANGFIYFIDFRIYNSPVIPKVLTAQVGQTIVVKAVDENGKPTEWQAVDMPTDEHINALIDAKLEAIANGTY